MAYQLVYPQGVTTVTVPAASSVAVYTYGRGMAKVNQLGLFPNYPAQSTQIGTVSNTTTTFGPFASGAVLTIEAGADVVYFEVGVTPLVKVPLDAAVQPTPVAVNVTGAVSALAIMGGIVTSTTGAAVAGTIPTGTVMDAASQWDVNDSVDWSVINTGGNTFTVTAAAGHTIVGAAAVATATSGFFRTVKTAANTFITYRRA